MAEWKKVVVSGSNITQLNNNANYLINGQSGAILTGSFSGSFVGTTNLPDLTSGEGISTFTYDGSGTATVAVSGAAQLSNNAVTKWNDTDGKFVSSSLTDNGTTITGATSLQLTGASSSLTGSFTGSFKGDGSQLTGVTATSLANSLSQGTGITAFTFNGSTAQSVEVSGSGTLSANTLTKWTGNAFADTSITDNGTLVTVTNDALFQGDIIVQGTASFQNTQNLLVADRFVLFASGSVATGDGGIVVQQGTQNVGELYGYDSTTTRWGFTSSFNSATGNSFTPAVYVGAVQTGTGQTAASAAPIYGGSSFGYGTIHVDTDDSEIWIYA